MPKSRHKPTPPKQSFLSVGYKEANMARKRKKSITVLGHPGPMLQMVLALIEKQGSAVIIVDSARVEACPYCGTRGNHSCTGPSLLNHCETDSYGHTESDFSNCNPEGERTPAPDKHTTKKPGK